MIGGARRRRDAGRIRSRRRRRTPSAIGSLELLVGRRRDGEPGRTCTLDRGALVDVEGPLGRFTFPRRPDERRFLFIAGGTGIAPLRAMLRHALSVPHDGIGLLYSARTAGEFAYEDELRGAGRRAGASS